MTERHAAKPVSSRPVRVIAATIIDRVLAGQSLTRQLEEMGPKVAQTDRAVLAEMVYGSCRWYHRLDAALSLLMKKPLRSRDRIIHALLLCGLYQLQYMRIKPHAVVAETVNAVRALKRPMLTGLVNGVLRHYQREADKIQLQLDAQSGSRFSMPSWLLGKLEKAWPAHWETVAQTLLQAPPLTLRVNRLKISVTEYQQLLDDAQMKAHRVPGIDSALVLEKPVGVEKLPGFAEGLVSVQDAGAQLAAMLLNVTDGEKVLDACAAPGGKTGHLLEQARIELTAVDDDAARLQRVTENLQRLGLTATVTVGDASQSAGEWAEQLYEAVLLDVPCSATGVIRRHPDIKLLRSPADIDQLAGLQQQILENAWSRLKPGGRLLYATCSLMPEENDRQVAAFADSHENASVRTLAPEIPHVKCGRGIQLLPGLAETDGFYYALIDRTD